MNKIIELIGLSCTIGCLCWYYVCMILSGGTAIWYWEPNPVIYIAEVGAATFALIVVLKRLIEVIVC